MDSRRQALERVEEALRLDAAVDKHALEGCRQNCRQSHESSIFSRQFESGPDIKTKPATGVTVAGLANFLLGELRDDAGRNPLR